jgi:hypothetical protein
VIEGKNGTLIGGETTKEIPLPDGEIKAIVFSPGEGNDQVTVDLEGLPEGKRFEEFEIEDTDQNDTGNDTVTVKNVSLKGRGRLKVGHDTGDDTTVIDGCDATNLNVGAGLDDDVTIRNCNATKRIKIDGTPDNLTIEDSFYPDLQIESGKPGGTVQPSRQTWIQRTTGKKVSYSGGSADEEVAFIDNQIESVSAKLGDGNDLISFAGSTIEKASVDGGQGALDCFDDTQAGNVFGSLKQKGFEDCDGPVTLQYFGLGADPIDEPPQDAVAWRPNNPEIGHSDGPFALPGAKNPLALPVLDPLLDVSPAHWADPDFCEWIHLHGDFEGHDDPAPGPPATKSACGHGALEWARLVPAP